MSWRTLAAAAALATSLTGAAAEAPPPVDPAIDVLKIERDRYQRMTVPVTIQGQGPFDFLIDTGAQATVLSRDLADRLQLYERGTATLIGMASSRLVETTPIDDFTLGTRSFYIRQAPVLERAHIGEADGILGLDSLQDQRVLLDFDKRRISVADAEQLGGNRGYEIVVKARQLLGQLIITSARLDGVRVAVIVDTGAQGSVGNMALLARLRRNRQLGDNVMTDVNGISLGGVVRVGRMLELGQGGSVQNFPILFADSRPFHQLGLADEPALILGMSELRLFRRVAIDFKTQRVLFDLPPEALFRPLIFTNGAR